MDEIVKIELFGEEFRFKPDGRVENSVEIAEHVKGFVEEAEALFKNSRADRNKIAILLLAAMNISKDYYELKLQYSELEKDIEKRISSLLYKIDKGIE